MVSVSLRNIRDRDYILGADFSDARLFLTNFAKKMGEDIDVPLKIEKLGSQEYFAFKKVSHEA
jgi:hypothetical protein